MGGGMVMAVAKSGNHAFSKPLVPFIDCVEGLGVEGDAHQGRTVKHRSRVKVDPTQPNLRQVHLIHAELFDAMASAGFHVGPGDLGENITSKGVDLLGLPRGALLAVGQEAVLEVTGLRNPCAQIEAFQAGLLKEVLEKREDGTLIRKSGIMAIVKVSGRIETGDAIKIIIPDGPHEPLERV